MHKFLPALFLLLSAGLSGQQSAPGIRCGNDIFSQIVHTNYPALQDAFDQTFQQAQQQAGASDRSPLAINVIVHVVWKEDAENIADSIIENQIQILNEDYNRLNPDTGNLRDIFKPVAGNADIHFHLASVVRVQTSEIFEVDVFGNDLLSNLKHADQGGSDAVNTEQFLNIWVCKIQPLTIFGLEVGQILGFAFPPNGLDNWPEQSAAPSPEEDGVVIDYRAFGRNNPNPIANPDGSGNLLIRGRSPVHEVGHYLGLRHIWGDGGTFGPNDCAQSDGIDDTPYASAQSEFDCDTTKNTCEQVEMYYNADMPDLIENYMDYSSEVCMNMFTQGQVAQMRSVLQGPRAGLLNPVATHTPVGAGIDWTIAPNPASDRISVSFSIQNASTAGFRIIGLDGRVCRTLAQKVYGAGKQVVSVDTQGLSAGIYMVQIQTEAGVATRRLELLR